MTTFTFEIRPIPGFGGRYYADTLGNIWSTVTTRGNSRLSPSTDHGGYKRVGLSYGGRERKYGVHRLVLLTFVGEPPAGLQGRHLDRDPSNNRLSNLAYGTQAQNEADKVLHGTVGRGEKNHQSKLTAPSVEIIRELIVAGESLTVIASYYGVSRNTIAHIAHGRTWSYLNDQHQDQQHQDSPLRLAS